MLAMMIKDTSGKTELMMQERPGQGVDIGEQAKNASKHLEEVILQHS
jgi:hypothetical protein